MYLLVCRALPCFFLSGSLWEVFVIRGYRNGDALRVLVQKAQIDEAEEGAVCFDNVGKYTLLNTAGDVMAVFGYAGEKGGVADCYALIAETAGRNLFEAVRFLRLKIPEDIKREGFVGAQMTVKMDFAAGGRFARMLGFREAEILPKFYNENDYQLFERI